MNDIILTAPYTYNTSYGMVANSLSCCVPSLKLNPIGGNIEVDPKISKYKDLKNRVATPQELAGKNISVVLFHQNLLDQHPAGAEIKIGFPIFELNKFREDEVQSINNQDYLFICSQWAKKIVLDNTKFGATPEKVFVIPLGYDPDQIPRASQFNTKKNVVFANVGKWEYRKGHDFLASVFADVFGKTSDVELMMAPTNFFIGEANLKWQDQYRKILGNKVRFVDRVDSHKDFLSLLNYADVFVLPSRAEGWNMPALEAMAMNKLVILTNYSAHTEYATPENSLLIQPSVLCPAYDGVWFHGHGEWMYFGDSEFNQLKHHLRRAYQLIKNKYRPSVSETVKRFTWENSAKIFMDHINAIISN